MNKEERIIKYKERQEEKVDRYSELSEKAGEESNRAYSSSKEMADLIPFGQPILVGHHSEKRHRRDIARIGGLMDKSISLSEKSNYYAGKVQNIENSKVINSDDPEAIDKLKEKIKGLEEKRERLKAYNKKAKKEGKPLLDWYILPYLSADIRRAKKRIAELEAVEKIQEVEEDINGITLKVDKDDNRVKIIFPVKPSEEIRSKLKRNGFHWSPYNNAWQRKTNEYSIRIAKEIIKAI